jgi:hypothetical protein
MKFMLNYDRQSVGQSVLVLGSHPKPMTRFLFSVWQLRVSCCGAPSMLCIVPATRRNIAWYGYVWKFQFETDNSPPRPGRHKLRLRRVTQCSPTQSERTRSSENPLFYNRHYHFSCSIISILYHILLSFHRHYHHHHLPHALIFFTVATSISSI